MKRSRSAKVAITNEARVLRQMREAHGLSMRKAGELIGLSDSYISQIENGRMDIPTGHKLQRLLDAYGGIKIKSFQERVRSFRQAVSPRDELADLVGRLSDAQILTILAVVKGLLNG